jgi:hypothetical protein
MNEQELAEWRGEEWTARNTIEIIWDGTQWVPVGTEAAK